MRITSTFKGALRFDSGVRGHTVVVDNPVESGGSDAGPTPPELVATALGTCVGIYAVNYCNRHGISTEGLVVHTDWEKALHPARIGTMRVSVELPAGVPEEKRDAFMRTIQQCMVHNTLHMPPEVTIELAD